VSQRALAALEAAMLLFVVYGWALLGWNIAHAMWTP
jgi:hypothetical protein